MQVTLEFWCECGLKMEVYAANFAACTDEDCPAVLNLPRNFNRHNGQLTPEQCVAIAEQIEKGVYPTPLWG